MSEPPNHEVASVDQRLYASFHENDPGTTGAHQCGPRVIATYGGNGEWRALTTSPLNKPITHVGLWSAPVGGTFYGAVPITDYRTTAEYDRGCEAVVRGKATFVYGDRWNYELFALVALILVIIIKWVAS